MPNLMKLSCPKCGAHIVGVLTLDDSFGQSRGGNGDDDYVYLDADALKLLASIRIDELLPRAQEFVLDMRKNAAKFKERTRMTVKQHSFWKSIVDGKANKKRDPWDEDE